MIERIQCLDTREMTATIADVSYGKLSSTSYAYNLDAWFFALTDAPRLEIGTDLVEYTGVRSCVDMLLQQGHRLAFFSGGFDLGMHHLSTLTELHTIIPKDVLVIMGIETDDYIRHKGREPVFDQSFRLQAVASVLKQQRKLGVAFPMPQKNDELSTSDHYRDLVNSIGMYRRNGCYHLYTLGYPFREEKINRMIEPAEWCCLLPGWRFFNPPSVTDQLNTHEKR